MGGPNTATQVTVSIQMTDLLTPGSPVTYQRNSAPTIFNSIQNELIQYLLAPAGTTTFPLGNLGVENTVGIIYIKNISAPNAPVALVSLDINSAIVTFPLNPGGVLLYCIPGNSGAVGIPVGPSALSDIFAVTTADTLFEYLLSA